MSEELRQASGFTLGLLVITAFSSPERIVTSMPPRASLCDRERKARVVSSCLVRTGIGRSVERLVLRTHVGEAKGGCGAYGSHGHHRGRK